MTTAPAYEKGKLYQIPVTDLAPDPDQPRKVIGPEALAELVTSIEKFGIIQPLLFRDAGEGRLLIVAGERRWQAAGQLGGIVGKARTTVRDILTINRLPQTIRDECRGDRTITRQALIDIARKKQERGMITAYNAFRIKQQKAKEAGKKSPDKPRGKGLNDPAAALEFAQKIDAKISNIDTTDWTSEDREKVCNVLIAVKDKIDIFITPNPVPA